MERKQFNGGRIINRPLFDHFMRHRNERMHREFCACAVAPRAQSLVKIRGGWPAGVDVGRCTQGHVRERSGFRGWKERQSVGDAGDFLQPDFCGLWSPAQVDCGGCWTHLGVLL